MGALNGIRSGKNGHLFLNGAKNGSGLAHLNPLHYQAQGKLPTKSLFSPPLLTSFRHLLLRVTLLLISGLVILYDLLTFPLYLVLQQPWSNWHYFSLPRSVREEPSESNEVVCSSVKELPTPEHYLLQCKTIDEALDRAMIECDKDDPCLGYREVISAKSVIVEGKPVLQHVLTGYKWMNYGEFYRTLCRFGHGLAKLGITKGDKVMIYAETCPNWLIAGQGIIKNGSVLVTLYSTLGDSGIVHGIQETEVQYIVTSKVLAAKLVRLRSQLGRLKKVIILEAITENELANLQEAFDAKSGDEEEENKVIISSMSELIESGDADYYRKNKMNILPEDVAIIMYTSGSGGVPKGVMITHKNFISGFESILSLVGFFVHEMPTHTYIGYLPLAHILEFATETFLILVGGRIGYSSPHTITDLSMGIAPGTPGDATLLRPTLMATVPLVCDRIRKAIYARLNSKGLLAVRLFEYIIDYKTFWTSKGFSTPLLDALILSRFRAVVGGRIQIMMTGGASLSADTQKFIKAVLNVTFAQGYGSTETIGSGLFMDQYDQTLAKVGGPLYGCKVKLVDWPEGGYCTADKPNPRGEIHVSSEALSIGYYNLPLLTAEAFYEDADGRRWFRSGDIGELYPNGTFKIIDRKKSFIKLQFGEYISLGKIETKLKTSYIVNNICVVGNSLYNYVIAIVVPNPKALLAVGKSLERTRKGGKRSKLLEEINESALYENEAVKERILLKLEQFARANGLRRYEIPRGLILVKDDWTPEGGLVTASFKLKRKSIEQHYHEAIQKAFSRLE